MTGQHWTERGSRPVRWLLNRLWEWGDRIVAFRLPWERRR